MARTVRSFSAVTAAAVLALATELSMPVSVSARFGDALVVVHAAASGDAQPPAVGQHTPYAVPFGPVFAAHDAPESQAAWLMRSGKLDPTAVQELRSHLDAIRDRGFSVERLGPSALRLVQVLQDVRTDATSDVLAPLMQALMSEIVQSGLGPGVGRHPVTTIAVPIFDGRGRQTQTLNAHPFRSMTAPEAAKVAKKLVGVARSVGPAPS
jgi:DNA-binding IclR family transcriptional regulator